MENPDKKQLAGFKILAKETGDIYKKSWQKFVVLMLIPLAFSFFYTQLVNSVSLFVPSLAKPFVFGLGLANLIVGAIFFVLNIASYIATVVLLKDLQQAVTFKNVFAKYKAALPYFWRTVLISGIYGAISVVATICLIVPGVMFMVYYSFAVYVVLFEEAPLEQGFGKSRELVRGYFWAVLGRLLLGIIAVLAFYLAVVLVCLALFVLARYGLHLKFSDVLTQQLANLVSIYLSLVISPLAIIFQYNLYQELKKIK